MSKWQKNSWNLSILVPITNDFTEKVESRNIICNPSYLSVEIAEIHSQKFRESIGFYFSRY